MPSLWGGGRVVVRAVAKIVVAVTGIVTTIAPATAQSWPTRPLTIVYPFAAGSADEFWDESSRRVSPNFWANQ